MQKKIEGTENTRKKIIYWGIGKICQYCLECHPEVTPVFFVDSYLNCKVFKGKIVRHPEEIDCWTEYYVIVTIKANDAKVKIQKFLEEKGLHKGSDFCTYKEYFSWPDDVTVEMSICKAESYMKNHPKMLNPMLLKIPLEGTRNNNTYTNFLSNYFQKRGEESCIIFSLLRVMTDEQASNKYNCPVIPLPTRLINQKDKAEYIRELTENELEWLKELENRENRFYECVNMYYYYKSIIELIRPFKVIIWSNWNRESYILGHLAEIYGIPCGYMEYGWVPGTYQIDPRGIAGQSEYAVNPMMFEKMKVDDIYDIEQVKQYVRESKLDTGIFIDTKEDKDALLKIQPNKKNIFLVGLGEKGLQINPKSNYWIKYVSSVVESTEEVLIQLIELSRKNNWNLIFKPHPGEPVPELEHGLEDVIIVWSMEIDRLICLADVVVSIASAVDYKVLIYGKPLVQLGITGLLGKGCTYTVSKKEMLEEQILLAIKNGMTKKQTENYNRLLQILLQKYLWDDMSDRSLRYGLPVEKDFLE